MYLHVSLSLHQHSVLLNFKKKIFSNILSKKWHLLIVFICISHIMTKTKHPFIIQIPFLPYFYNMANSFKYYSHFN